MAYQTEAEPERGVPLDVIAGVRRIVAPNPGPMTYHGTNTFLIETPDGLLVLDPGPNDEGHLQAVADAAGGKAVAIVLSHGHYDHCAGAATLQRALDVPIYGFEPFDSKVATIDRALRDRDRLFGMTVLFTPGHASDHICLATDDGVVFTGDHVMAWSSSVVPFPSGSMVQFIANLRLLAGRHDRLHLPGHGPALPDPTAFIEELIGHRLRREEAIVAAIADASLSAEEIVAMLYGRRGQNLSKAAEHNVLSHLTKLELEGKVECEGPSWRAKHKPGETSPTSLPL